MGSCVPRNSKAISIQEPPRGRKYRIMCIKTNDEYLNPAIKKQIFKVKDEKVPKLNLDINTFYANRMKRTNIVS